MALAYKIRYHDFWPNFDPERFVLTKMIQEIIKSKPVCEKNENAEVDLEIWSVFTFKSQAEKILAKAKSNLGVHWQNDYEARALRGHRTYFDSKCKKKIWYTGENFRAPVGIFDATISFDPSDRAHKNIFFPYWMARIDWGLDSKQDEIYPRIEDLVSPRRKKEAGYKVCSFSSVNEPIRRKIQIGTQEASSKFHLEKFGSLYNNRVESKLSVAQNYSFQICNENDIYPNYVTEKLQEAYMCQNIPIWAGLDQDSYFNKEAIIDVTNMSIEEISRLLTKFDKNEFHYKFQQPILKKVPNFSGILNEIAQVI